MLHKDNKNEARAVFEILVRENQAMLMTYLRAIARNKSLIDDLFQETMLIAWQKLDEYDRDRPFGPWLRGIAAKLVMAQSRKAKSDIMTFESEFLEYLSQQLQHISERPGDTWDEKIAALTHCIEALSDQYQQAIKLRYFEQTPALQIAVISQTSIETIKKRLQRARSQLLDCLKHKKVVVEMTA
jgi:RNA polymerase sigma-70 factor (ECF subfamily)